jgi:hypothetical protein
MGRRISLSQSRVYRVALWSWREVRSLLADIVGPCGQPVL